jgi:hypothetical protein
MDHGDCLGNFDLRVIVQAKNTQRTMRSANLAANNRTAQINTDFEKQQNAPEMGRILLSFRAG